MNIFQILPTIETAISLLNVIASLEPAIEKDVKDILSQMHKVRAAYEASNLPAEVGK